MMQMKTFAAAALLSAASLCSYAQVTGDALAAKISAREQITDVPTVYLTIPDVTDLDKDLTKNRETGEALYHTMQMQVVDGSGQLAEFTEDYDADAKFAQIKVRGNSTASAYKRAYRVKFAKKHKHDLLGAGYDKRNWTLLANCFDRSLIRNAVTYHLGKALGMPFNPGYRFVDLVINDDYRGCYQISDHVEAGKNRVDVDEDTGWMIELQGRDDMLDKPYCYVAEGNGYMFNVKNPDGDDYIDEATGKNTAEWTEIFNNIVSWMADWNDSFNSWSTKNWRDYNDEETLIKFYLITNITGDYDGLMSVKAYKEAESNQMKWGPIWDKDLAYGNCTYDKEITVMNEDIDNASSVRWKFKNTLNKDTLFVASAKRYLDAVNKDGALLNELCTVIDQLGAQTAQAWKQNFSRWDIKAIENGEISKLRYNTQAEYLNQLKGFLRERLNVVETKINDEYADLKSPSLDITATIGKNGYGSFSYPLSVDFSATGVEVFTGELSADGSQVNLVKVEDGKVPAGTGVILKGTASTTVKPTLLTEWVDKKEGNLFVSTAPSAYKVTESQKYYALGNINGVTAFYPVASGVEVPQYKLYFTIADAAGAKGFYPLYDATTGIRETIAADPTATPIIYNVMGERVGSSYKGIVIENGKKRLNK